MAKTPTTTSGSSSSASSSGGSSGSGGGGSTGAGSVPGSGAERFDSVGQASQDEAVNQAKMNEEQTVQNIRFNGAAARAGTRMRSASQAAQAAGPA